VETELSKALAAWTDNANEASFEDRAHMLGLFLNHDCIPSRGPEPRSEGPRQDASGVTLFCHCPEVAVLPESKSTERRMVGEGICLMSDIPEF
jgi:hypothetical protein